MKPSDAAFAAHADSIVKMCAEYVLSTPKDCFLLLVDPIRSSELVAVFGHTSLLPEIVRAVKCDPSTLRKTIDSPNFRERYVVVVCVEEVDTWGPTDKMGAKELLAALEGSELHAATVVCTGAVRIGSVGDA